MDKPIEHIPVPPDCFDLQAINSILAIEGKVLQAVDYFAWMDREADQEPKPRFLLALRLHFADGATFMVSSGEDSEGIHLTTETQLNMLAQELMSAGTGAAIQRMPVGDAPLWQDLQGEAIRQVLLEKNESGFYYNKALLLVFSKRQILIALGLEGLRIAPYP